MSELSFIDRLVAVEGMRPQIINLGDAIREVSAQIDAIPARMRPVASTESLDNKRLKALEATLKLVVAELREIRRKMRPAGEIEVTHEEPNMVVQEFFQ